MIANFRNEYNFLSNFYSCLIHYGGHVYNNAEAAFQAQKVLSWSEREKFTNLTGSEAKKLGKQVNLRKDWENVKLNIMYEIVLEKFKQNPKLRDYLIGTGNE